MEFVKYNQLLKICVSYDQDGVGYTADEVGEAMTKIMHRLTFARFEYA